jgi:hypothetical protein
MNPTHKRREIRIGIVYCSWRHQSGTRYFPYLCRDLRLAPPKMPRPKYAIYPNFTVSSRMQTPPTQADMA